MISEKKDLASRSGIMIAEAALKHANKNNWDIAVAVCDRSGSMIAFMRTENVISAAVDFAIDKAFTAAVIRKATHEFGERMASSMSLSLGVGTRPRLITWTGGMPIYLDNVCVGGIGVSGALDHQDLECAATALRAVGLQSSPN